LLGAERPAEKFKDPGKGLSVSLQPPPEPLPVDAAMGLQEIGREGVANPHDAIKLLLLHHPAAIQGKGDDLQALRMGYDRDLVETKSATPWREDRGVDVHFQTFVSEEMHEVVTIPLCAAFFRQEFPYAEGDLHTGGTASRIF
jgi:hypothetical protein